MEYQRVQSSNIRDIGYDAEKAELRVIFQSGKEFAYSNVSPAAHKALMKADSKGAHFNAHIKSNTKDHPARPIEDE